jgi:hypothetical protein
MKCHPFAGKIFAGEINASTGEPLRHELAPDKQDYIVVPRQPRLYGYCTAHNETHQFVAMILASGYPMSEQIAGFDEAGGIQIIVYPMKADRYGLRPPVEALTGQRIPHPPPTPAEFAENTLPKTISASTPRRSSSTPWSGSALSRPPARRPKRRRSKNFLLRLPAGPRYPQRCG